MLGFLPQELLGTSMYEYYHHEDISHLADTHKTALQNQETVKTQVNLKCNSQVPLNVLNLTSF